MVGFYSVVMVQYGQMEMETLKFLHFIYKNIQSLEVKGNKMETSLFKYCDLKRGTLCSVTDTQIELMNTQHAELVGFIQKHF